MKRAIFLCVLLAFAATRSARCGGSFDERTCGDGAPEWMRTSEKCRLKAVSDEYQRLGTEIQTAESARLFRRIVSAGTMVASTVLAGAGVVACVGTCGQLCPGPTGVAGLAATAAASAADAFGSGATCPECDDLKQRQGFLLNDGGFTEGMSQEARAEANEMFDMFDTDESGRITYEELEQASIELGETPDRQEIEAMIETSDIDGDGMIERIEFVISMHRSGGLENDPGEGDLGET